MKKLTNKIAFAQKHKEKIIVLFILVLGYILRTFNQNWDSGFHMHPDERAIVMFTLPLALPQTFAEFLSPQSPLNPHFFAYGSFPLYLLKFSGYIFSFVDPRFADYSHLQMVGRFISSLIDSTTIALTFILSSLLFNKKVGIIAAFLYATAVLPIQLSHFYTVDPLLSLFLLVSMICCIQLFLTGKKYFAVLIGIFFGLAVATKFSAVIFILPILFTLVLLSLQKKAGQKKYVQSGIASFFINGTLIVAFFVSSVVFFQPYSVLDFSSFFSGVQEQSRMTRDAYTFPFTLQYVGKIPVWHEIKNLFFGFGIFQTILIFIGLPLIFYKMYKKREKPQIALTIVIFFVVLYFTTVSSFAVGWMRYMLPLYPYLSMIGAYAIYKIFKRRLFRKNKKIAVSTGLLTALLLLAWPLSFMHIYLQENTRVQATEWVLQNIPSGSTLAFEHWDDRVPIYNGEQYLYEELTLYDYPDSEIKWELLNQKIARSDYIIITSNRLYTPLQRLSDCSRFERCYPRTGTYYRDLFGNKLGFEKIAEFSVFPKIPFTHFEINDQYADESFSVYDHPKVMIFKRK